MKIRTGFVSNSSSSSFVINLNDITTEQLYKIENHFEVAQSMPGNNYECEKCGYIYPASRSGLIDFDFCVQTINSIKCDGDLYYNQSALSHYNTKDDAWHIVVNHEKNTVFGGTIIDNFNMENFLRQIGVPNDVITWGDY